MVHDIPDDVWTPKEVEKCLVEAVMWAQRSTPAVGPAGYRSGMPDPALSSDERAFLEWPDVTELEAQPMWRSYSPKKVSQMERVLSWPMKYLGKIEEESPIAYSTFKAWLHTKINKKAKFDQTCRQLGWSRATAYRNRDYILSRIAQGLTKDGIRRGEH